MLFGWKCNILNNKGGHLKWQGDSEKMFYFLILKRMYTYKKMYTEFGHMESFTHYLLISYHLDKFTSRLNSFRIDTIKLSCFGRYVSVTWLWFPHWEMNWNLKLFDVCKNYAFIEATCSWYMQRYSIYIPLHLCGYKVEDSIFVW